MDQWSNVSNPSDSTRSHRPRRMPRRRIQVRPKVDEAAPRARASGSESTDSRTAHGHRRQLRFRWSPANEGTTHRRTRTWLRHRMRHRGKAPTARCIFPGRTKHTFVVVDEVDSRAHVCCRGAPERWDLSKHRACRSPLPSTAVEQWRRADSATRASVKGTACTVLRGRAPLRWMPCIFIRRSSSRRELGRIAPHRRADALRRRRSNRHFRTGST